MLIIKPQIFNNFQEVAIGFSTKIGLKRRAPFYLNMSYNVGDISKTIDENRQEFFRKIGLGKSNIAFQTQVHGDKISAVEKAGNCGESDAMITSELNLGLIISSADCPAIFIYDKEKKIIAAAHSGWRSTEKKILEKTLVKLKDDFGSSSDNLICYISPSISQQNYEIGKDVAGRFDNRYVKIIDGKHYLDLRRANYEMLLNRGIKESNIQVSRLCTYEYSYLLHSYRREGENSGRAIGVIAVKGKN